MQSEKCKQLIIKIDSALECIKRHTDSGDEIKSYLAKFLTVFICGIYEELIETIINEWVSKLNCLEVGSFMSKKIKFSFQNPKYKKIKELLDDLSEKWGNYFKENINQKSIDALESIVNQKNNIAHGVDSTITITDIEKYYKDSLIIIKITEKIINKRLF